MDIVKMIKEEILQLNKKYMNEIDNYDFWEQHVKYVVKEALLLAEEYNADKEIVELGALLHDVALISNVGTKVDHHTNGAIIAEKLLSKYGYQKDRMSKVVGCVLNHRSSKNATSNEEMCVADADIIAHYDNIPMCFEVAFKYNKISNTNDKNEWIKYFEKDYNDLSDRTKQTFKERYQNIINVLFGEL